MGGIEENIVKQAVRFGQPIPDRIANAPQLNIGLDFYFQAFMDLINDRSNGQASIGPICWSNIKAYAEHYELDEDDSERLFYFIKEMDIEYVKKVNRLNGT